MWMCLLISCVHLCAHKMWVILLLGVVFQRVVVVIDADAKKQCAQALHQPFILPQVLWDLSRQLQESPSQGFIQHQFQTHTPLFNLEVGQDAPILIDI